MMGFINWLSRASLVAPPYRTIVAELDWLDRQEPLERIVPPPVAPLRIVPVKPRPSTESMAFLHVKDLLDEIPAARTALRKLKKFDRGAYQFHRRFGARITGWEGGKAGIRYNMLRKSVIESLPGVGLIFAVPLRYDGWSGEDDMRAYFYFQKMKRKAWAVEKCPKVKAHYEMSVVFTDNHITAGYSTTVAILVNGDVRVLKSIETKPHRLPDGELIWQRKLSLPAGLEVHYDDRKKNAGRGAGRNYGQPGSPEEFGAQLFCMALNSFDASNDGFQITATRDRLAVTFNVPGSRAKRFFKDRDIEIAADGRRRRIFHAVDEHDRLLKDGRTIKVAAHYRGARKFTWKGEAIRIAPQEQAQRGFDLEAVYSDERDPPRSEYVKLPPVGARMENMFERQADVRGGYRTAEKT